MWADASLEGQLEEVCFAQQEQQVQSRQGEDDLGMRGGEKRSQKGWADHGQNRWACRR